MPLTLTSPAFEPMGTIPSEFTCDGIDRSPPLDIDGVPPGAKGLALVVEDPDAPDPEAPAATWVHWILFDLPPNTTHLPAGAHDSTLPVGTRHGLNDWRTTRWRGPCPRSGRHRYFFRLYALDRQLGERAGEVTRHALNLAMAGHILEQAELIATYGVAAFHPPPHPPTEEVGRR